MFTNKILLIIGGTGSFGNAVLRRFLDTDIKPFQNYKIDKSLVCTRRDFAYPTPEFETMLIEMKYWIDDHSAYYSHYGYFR